MKQVDLKIKEPLSYTTAVPKRINIVFVTCVIFRNVADILYLYIILTIGYVISNVSNYVMYNQIEYDIYRCTMFVIMLQVN